jgi:hypothetical protein
MLEWMQDPELRKRVQVGLNKGEARNALARAVFFNRQGELRDRTFENQRYRASGLNLVVLAIILWNTILLFLDLVGDAGLFDGVGPALNVGSSERLKWTARVASDCYPFRDLWVQSMATKSLFRRRRMRCCRAGRMRNWSRVGWSDQEPTQKRRKCRESCGAERDRLIAVPKASHG